MSFLLGPAKSYLSQTGFRESRFQSWPLSSIFIARTGFPVNLTTSATGPDGNTNEQRPNLVPGQPFYLAGGNFNPAAFCTPGYRRPALPWWCLPRRIRRCPAQFLARSRGSGKSDLALSRRFPITEQVQLQFRAEVFNIFNRAQYANPDGLISASDFGKIYLPLNTTPIGMGTPRQFQFLLKVQF